MQVLFFLLTHDLYIYLFHRWQHANKWLWRTHEAHHSTKEVDFLAGTRSHALEILVNQTIEFAPIVLLGADPAVKAPGMIYGGVTVSGGRLFVATCTLEGPLARKPTCVVCVGK